MSFFKFFGGIRGLFIMTRDLEKNVGMLQFTTHKLETVQSLLQFLKPWAYGRTPHGPHQPSLHGSDNTSGDVLNNTKTQSSTTCDQTLVYSRRNLKRRDKNLVRGSRRRHLALAYRHNRSATGNNVHELYLYVTI